MFNRSSAFIICADGAWSKSSHAVLSEIGFAHIEHIAEADVLRGTSFSRPIQFCFLTPASSHIELRQSVNAIRGHKTDRHRYSPIIMLARALPRQQINDYISMGIDDIVQFPCSLKFMGDRLKRQLNRPLKYFETDSYFGPDRRRHSEGMPDHQEQRRGEADYREYLIQRDPFKGAQVLDVYDHQAAMTARAATQAG